MTELGRRRPAVAPPRRRARPRGRGARQHPGARRGVVETLVVALLLASSAAAAGAAYALTPGTGTGAALLILIPAYHAGLAYGRFGFLLTSAVGSGAYLLSSAVFEPRDRRHGRACSRGSAPPPRSACSARGTSGSPHEQAAGRAGPRRARGDRADPAPAGPLRADVDRPRRAGQRHAGARPARRRGAVDPQRRARHPGRRAPRARGAARLDPGPVAHRRAGRRPAAQQRRRAGSPTEVAFTRRARAAAAPSSCRSPWATARRPCRRRRATRRTGRSRAASGACAAGGHPPHGARPSRRACSSARCKQFASLEERNRIARDIHDGIAQELAALGYQVDALRAQAGPPGIPTARRPRRAARAAQRGDGRPAPRTSPTCGCASGPAPASARCSALAVQSFGSVTGVRTTVTVSEGQRRLDPRVEILVHRLVMDVLADAQASGARNAWVTLTTSVAGPAKVEVSHDGDPAHGAPDLQRPRPRRARRDTLRAHRAQRPHHG